MTGGTTLEDLIDDALPQTQCTRCGYPDCRRYAAAIARGEAGINQCPPGGQEGVLRLARITGSSVLPLDPTRGAEAPLRLARIDETTCIGCTLCVDSCPVDCIVGAPKSMHTVIEHHCTGCERCLPACPVDCIEMRVVEPLKTGWQAWSAAQAAHARARYAYRNDRTERDRRERERVLAAQPRPDREAAPQPRPHAPPPRTPRTVIEAALARARSRR